RAVREGGAARGAAAVPGRRGHDRGRADGRLDVPAAAGPVRAGRAARAPGRAAAVDYLTALGMDNVAAHEESLTAHALDALREINGVRILGPDTTKDRGGT